jgi:hypothetical protein
VRSGRFHSKAPLISSFASCLSICSAEGEPIVKPRRRTFCTAIVYSIIAALATSVGMFSCQAADRSDARIETGQPRELVNRPVCWVCETVDDLRGCEIAER